MVHPLFAFSGLRGPVRHASDGDDGGHDKTT